MNSDDYFSLDDPDYPPVYYEARRYFKLGFLFGIPLIGMVIAFYCWFKTRKFHEDLYWDDPEDIHEAVAQAKRTSLAWAVLSVAVLVLYGVMLAVKWPWASFFIIQPILALMIAIMSLAIWFPSKIYESIRDWTGDMFPSLGIISDEPFPFITTTAIAVFSFAGYMACGVFAVLFSGNETVREFAPMIQPFSNLMITILAIAICDQSTCFVNSMIKAFLIAPVAYMLMNITWGLVRVYVPHSEVVPLYFILMSPENLVNRIMERGLF